MGQKASPKSLRLKINENWKSLWFDDKTFASKIIEDIKIRDLIIKELKNALISDVLITRNANQITITIKSARPGIIIGRGGSGSEKIKKLIEKHTKARVKLNIEEIKRPDLDANCIAQGISNQIEKRMPFRRALKMAIEKAKDSNVKGIKIQIAGRLNGADIARREKSSYGSVPLSTLSKEVDYAYIPSLTTYGIIGIKVWVCKHEEKKIEN